MWCYFYPCLCNFANMGTYIVFKLVLWLCGCVVVWLCGCVIGENVKIKFEINRLRPTGCLTKQTKLEVPFCLRKNTTCSHFCN